MNDSPAISLEQLVKRYGGVTAVDEVDVTIGEGEFFSLLGPSGCGKTTTLRLIAGFEAPSSGRVLLRGQDVSHVPANRRNVNLVFQHYALFPHMCVEDNIAFGPRLKRVAKDERRSRVQGMLRVVALEGYERRRPSQLSGGQQQRVALARALINRPAALLLDEPLGALDVKLRKHMQLELKRIQHELGTTFLYVTHDQGEALAMSDRVAVMRDGAIEQVASPRELYERPETAFVADFIGSINTFELTISDLDGDRAIARLDGERRIVVPAGGVVVGDRVRAAVRTEDVRILPANGREPDGDSRAIGTVIDTVFLGMWTEIHVDAPGLGRVVAANRTPPVGVAEGAKVVLTWDAARTTLLPEAGA
jgi:spermidine/putrescine transport system ATP-binding protein